MIIYRDSNCSFELLFRFLNSPNFLTIMICLDLALCLLSVVENQLRYENANNLGLDLSGPFLKDTALGIIHSTKGGFRGNSSFAL